MDVLSVSDSRGKGCVRVEKMGESGDPGQINCVKLASCKGKVNDQTDAGTRIEQRPLHKQQSLNRQAQS